MAEQSCREECCASFGGEVGKERGRRLEGRGLLAHLIRPRSWVHGYGVSAGLAGWAGWLAGWLGVSEHGAYN